VTGAPGIVVSLARSAQRGVSPLEDYDDYTDIIP
jgi:hypothetical protein